MWTSVEDSGRSDCDLGNISEIMCDLGLELAKSTSFRAWTRGIFGNGVSRRAKVEGAIARGNRDGFTIGNPRPCACFIEGSCPLGDVDKVSVVATFVPARKRCVRFRVFAVGDV